MSTTDTQATGNSLSITRDTSSIDHSERPTSYFCPRYNKKLDTTEVLVYSVPGSAIDHDQLFEYFEKSEQSCVDLARNIRSHVRAHKELSGLSDEQINSRFQAGLQAKFDCHTNPISRESFNAQAISHDTYKQLCDIHERMNGDQEYGGDLTSYLVLVTKDSNAPSGSTRQSGIITDLKVCRNQFASGSEERHQRIENTKYAHALGTTLQQEHGLTRTYPSIEEIKHLAQKTNKDVEVLSIPEEHAKHLNFLVDVKPTVLSESDIQALAKRSGVENSSGSKNKAPSVGDTSAFTTTKLQGVGSVTRDEGVTPANHVSWFKRFSRSKQ
ncbi:uncharacterized protein IL334_005388 [Kwoniella shivajii]|uniref:Uncharacterized protein n=1 Tax=Kwoniella shivajii TaxID=564305 RepID=A0ABZ1D718_9TREE|nr:hypothetical protein IL334_005388 [Kwoniella shivajii]